MMTGRRGYPLKMLGFLLLLLPALLLSAAAEQTISIRTPEDLAAIAGMPEGHYVLENDLDMAGTEWLCPDFSGELDGGGFTIRNLTVTSAGSSRREVADGNLAASQAVFAGLFGAAENAWVHDLHLADMTLLVETDSPCFAGGFAGYAVNTSFTDCSISGTLELRAWNTIFGMGGAVGYGTGSLENCRVNTTLICADTRPERDEQFLGGAFGTGFFSLKNSEVQVDAYISEHGYVHSGGVIGMLMQYPLGMGTEAHIRGNAVTGRIRFFEDNGDRRAYCGEIYGELDRAWSYYIQDNQVSLQREETQDYSVELRP